MAAAELLTNDDDATIWSRLHSRQALVFGILATAIYLLILALPLLTVIVVPAISTGATVWLYSCGSVVDVVAAVWLLALGARYARRTRRGTLFSIPVVTPLVDRFLPLDRESR